MGKRELIASCNHDIYREEDRVLKLFQEGFSKEEVLREAWQQSLAGEMGILVPDILSVKEEGGQWMIVSRYIEGITLEQLMEDQPEQKSEYLRQMTELQLEIMKKDSVLFGKLKEKMERQIKAAISINENAKYELQNKLVSIPDQVCLCHGEFGPENIIVAEDGWYVLDWIHAALGNKSADAARTYLLFALTSESTAEEYLDIYCEKTGVRKSSVMEWVPLVAAAQLTKKRTREKELLQSWSSDFH